MRILTEGFEGFYRIGNISENHIKGLNSMTSFTTYDTESILEKSSEQVYKDSQFSLKVKNISNEKASLYLDISQETEIYFRSNMFLAEDSEYIFLTLDETNNLANKNAYILIENNNGITTLTLTVNLTDVATITLDEYLLNTWFRFELMFKNGLSGNIKVRINGIDLIDYIDDFAINYLHFGKTEELFGGICYIDDIAINNNVGTINNSWANEGNIVLLDNELTILNENYVPSVTESEASILNNRPFNDTKYLENETEGTLEMQFQNFIEKIQDLTFVYSTNCLSLFTRVTGNTDFKLSRDTKEQLFSIEISEPKLGFKQMEINGYKTEDKIDSENCKITKIQEVG